MEQLGDDEIRRLVVDGAPQEDHPVTEEPGVDVEGPLPARGLLDDRWHQHAISFRNYLVAVTLT